MVADILAALFKNLQRAFAVFGVLKLQQMSDMHFNVFGQHIVGRGIVLVEGGAVNACAFAQLCYAHIIDVLSFQQLEQRFQKQAAGEGYALVQFLFHEISFCTG